MIFGIETKSFLLGLSFGIPAGALLVGIIYFINIVLRINKKYRALHFTLRRMFGKNYTEVFNEEWDEIEEKNRDLTKGINKIIIH